MTEIDEELQENISQAVLAVLGDEAKGRFAVSLDDQDRKHLAQVILIESCVCKPELEAHRSDASFQEIHGLLEESKKQGSVSQELKSIYQRNLQRTRWWLRLKRAQVARTILGNQLPSYQVLKRRGDTDHQTALWEGCYAKCEANLREKYEIASRDLDLCGAPFLYLDLSMDLLRADVSDRDLLDELAFLIDDPRHNTMSLLLLDDKWNSFPLKWYMRHLSASLLKYLFWAFKKGDDLSEYFVLSFSDTEFKPIKTNLDNPFAKPPFCTFIGPRRPIIEEALSCYAEGLNFAAVSTILPVIEGLLWNFALLLDSQGEGIFVDSVKPVAIDRKSGKYLQAPTIGTLLKQTTFAKFLDKDFVSYFCDELYSERNPVLHGEVTQYGTRENAAKKLGTLEYLLRVIVESIQLRIQGKIADKIPNIFREQVVPQMVKSLLKKEKPGKPVDKGG